MSSFIVSGFGQHDRSVETSNTSEVQAAIEFDRWVGGLSSVIVAAQDFSEADLTRATNFILAAGSLMLSRSRLKTSDQRIFESNLRAAAAKRSSGGY